MSCRDVGVVVVSTGTAYVTYRLLPYLLTLFVDNHELTSTTGVVKVSLYSSLPFVLFLSFLLFPPPPSLSPL